MTEIDAPGVERVVGALRHPSDEVQTTRTIHAFAASDPTFARAFMTLVIELVRSQKNDFGARARRLPEPAWPVACERERGVGLDSVNRGRCDLWFTSSAGTGFTLAVELKHRARYTTGQLEKYLHELTQRVPHPSALVVITGRAHPQPPRVVQRNAKWLGELSWSRLYDAGLLRLPFNDPNLEELWHAFIKTLRSDGDLGRIATVNVERLTGWANGHPGGRWHDAEQLLAGVSEEAHEILEERVRSRGLHPRAPRATKSGHLVEVPRSGRGEINLAFDLSLGSERLQVVLAPSSGSEPCGRVEVWFFPRPTQKTLRARDGERRAGFRYDAASKGWSHRTALQPVASGFEFAAQILKEWRAALPRLEKLGAFDGLAPNANAATRAGNQISSP